MTRDFNKQRRDDVRPSSRNSSSNRYREERPSRPPRPRLNREAVDRAWENGANHEHADYRTRSNNAPPRRDSGRYDRNQYGNSPAFTRGTTPSRPSRNNPAPPRDTSPSRPSRPFDAPNSRNSRGYSDRSESSNRSDRGNRFDRFDRSSHGYSDRPESSNRSDRGDRFDRSTRFDRSDRGDRFNRPGPRPTASGFRGDARPYERNRYQGYDNRDNRDNRNNEYQNNRDRQPGEFDRDTRPPRSFDRSRQPYRDREQYDRGPYRPGRSRPMAQGGYPPRRQDFGRPAPQYAPQKERFEGDYERFNSLNRDEREERPAPRKDAQFRAEIADEADTLVNQVTPAPTRETTHQEPAAPTKKPSRKKENEGAKKPRTEGTARSKKPRAKGEKVARPDSGSLKPSQRGFKWPTP